MARGGNRQRLRARSAGLRPPAPPRGTSELEARMWNDLADQVEQAGTYHPSLAASFRQLVRVAGRAASLPLDAPPGPASACEQRLAVALATWGLTPQARASMEIVDPPAPSPLDEFA